jgi:hypothetical protein
MAPGAFGRTATRKRVAAGICEKCTVPLVQIRFSNDPHYRLSEQVAAFLNKRDFLSKAPWGGQKLIWKTIQHLI